MTIGEMTKTNPVTDPAVRILILRIINEAMEKGDRYVTINFFDGEPFVSVYPLMHDEEES